MKFISTVAALLAVSASAASAFTTSGTIYIYANSMEHPKTTFVKKGSGSELVSDGVACKGPNVIPGKKHPGALYGEFTTVDNVWGFNHGHDNEYEMGYIKVVGTNNCLSLVKGEPLAAKPCPSFSEEIKVGNKFAWYHDSRGSAMWAYSGSADGDMDNGIIFDKANLQTTGKTIDGVNINNDSEQNVFLSLGYVGLGDTGKSPTGCQ